MAEPLQPDCGERRVDVAGATLEPGPEMYFILLRDMARAFKECLAPVAGG